MYFSPTAIVECTSRGLAAAYPLGPKSGYADVRNTTDRAFITIITIIHEVLLVFKNDANIA